jgi:hypothetical protein
LRSILTVRTSRRALLGNAAALFLRWPFLGCSPTAVANKTTVRLGDDQVEIVITERGPGGLTFISLHENEQTAVTAVRHLLQLRGGRLVELRSRGQRLVSFRLRETEYTFDPNRIFTDVGLEKSLRLYGPYSDAAQDAAKQLRKRLLTSFRPGPKPIVAVHNNANKGYSLTSYEAGGSLEHEAASVGVNAKADTADFFVVLDPGLFTLLRAAGFNVVLQSSTPTDDGSLSVYCQRRRIPYVNVEAGHGHTVEQQRMLEALFNTLKDHGGKSG